MSKQCFLGIDTSNYTTSVAIAADGEILANLKAPLPVKLGECGLRQSDALFAHIKNLPELADKLRDALDDMTVCAVGVSSRPRNQEGSYMPCFLAGVSAAETAAAVQRVPLFRFSHQCGHLRAALYSAGQSDLRSAEFGAFHISGGTTEMLAVAPGENGFAVRIVGGTRDLNAGQLIDRIGVMLGVPFPCGAKLEALARENVQKVPRKKVKTENGYLHLSGVQNLAEKLYAQSGDASLCAAFVFSYLADAVIAMSRDFRAEHGAKLPMVYAGGVMSNRIIRERVLAEIDNAYFAEPAFSCDNAAGIALLTEEKYRAAACRES